MEQQLNSIKNESEKIKSEVREKTATYIAGGLGIVVGLAWNEAIKGLIDHIFPASSANTLMAKFGYAIVLTIAVVIITKYLFRIQEESSSSSTNSTKGV